MSSTKCPQRYDIRHSKDVILRDVSEILIHFFRKLIDTFLLVSHDAKLLLFLPKPFHENYHTFLCKNNIRSAIYRKTASLTCFFHHFYAISIISLPSCELLLHNARNIGSHNIFERLVPNEYEHCTHWI